MALAFSHVLLLLKVFKLKVLEALVLLIVYTLITPEKQARHKYKNTLH